MKQILFVILFLSFCSCRQEQLPSHSASIHYDTAYQAAPPVPVDTNSISGVMMVIRTGIPGKYYAQEWSWFYNERHTAYLPMDSLQFNGFPGDGLCYWPTGYPMPVRPPNLYHNSNSGATEPCTDFHIDNNISWVAVNDSNGISVHYNYASPFPEYFNGIPASARITEGLKLTLNSTTVAGADSVEVQISDNYGITTMIKKVFGAQQGDINISLSNFANSSSIKLVILPFHYTIQNFNGRSYAFIKEGKTEGVVTLTQ